MKYYKTCKDLVLYNFFEILDTNDYKWLIKGYEGEGFEDSDTEKLQAIWMDVFDEYILLLDDEDSKEYYRTIAEVAELEYDLQQLDVLINTYGITTENDLELEVRKALSSIGYPVDANKPKKEEFDRLIRNKKGLRTKISNVKSKNQSIFNKKEKDEKKKVNRYADIAAVEKLTDRKGSINPRTTVLALWVEYLKEFKQERRRLEKQAIDGRRKS